MGRRNRERLMRIRAGEETPISAREREPTRPVWRRCGKCGHVVAESLARGHIRACWGVEIADGDPIPKKAPGKVMRATERQLRKYGNVGGIAK